MFYKRLKQENKELKYMVELLKKQNDEKRKWIINSIETINSKRRAFGLPIDNAETPISDWRSVHGEFASKSYVLKETPVSDLKCSARLRNILKGLIYRNEDQSFKSVFKIYSKRDLQEHKGIGIKLFDELDSMRLEAGIEYKN